MKRQSTGHRWTQEEMTALITLWHDDEPIEEIAKAFNISVPGLNKVVTRLRNSGVPLRYKKNGNKAGRKALLWSQAEVEYLMRRRHDGISTPEIAAEMNRTAYGVQGMIMRLRKEDVPVGMLGQGVKRLYDVTTLKAQYSDATSPLTTKY